MRLKVFTFLVLALAVISFAGLAGAVMQCTASISSSPSTFSSTTDVTVTWSAQACEFADVLIGPHYYTTTSGSVTNTISATQTSDVLAGHYYCGSAIDECPDGTLNYKIYDTSASATSTYISALSPPTVTLSGGTTVNIGESHWMLLITSQEPGLSCTSSWGDYINPLGGSYTTGIITQSTTFSVTCTDSATGLSRTGSTTFTVSTGCGDGTCQAGETRTNCAVDCNPLCGNGILQTSIGEVCDSGSQNGVACTPTYGGSSCTYCSSSCTVLSKSPPYCGDGIIQSANGEQCDDGNLANGDGCSSTCQTVITPVCGNGIIESPETCDDGNTANSDGCSYLCTVQDGWTCLGQPSTCTPIGEPSPCGNGQIDGTEQCDDGGSNGACPATCSATCTTNSCGGGLPPPPPPPVVCTLTSASWSLPGGNTTEGNNVSLLVQGTSCSGQTVSFNVLEYDITSGNDPVQKNPISVTFSGNTATGMWTTEWQDDGALGGNPEYFFTATVSGATGSPISSGTSSNQLLTVIKNDVLQCTQVTTCGDYTAVDTCTLDQCSVVQNSVPSGTNCSSSDISCYCSWNAQTSSCNARVDESLGTCMYTQQTTDDCSDGFLTFRWTAQWTYAPGNGPENDTQGLAAQCVDGSKIVECPAQIALPGFSALNVISVIVVIVLVYWALSMKKGKKGKSSGKKKKR